MLDRGSSDHLENFVWERGDHDHNNQKHLRKQIWKPCSHQAGFSLIFRGSEEGGGREVFMEEGTHSCLSKMRCILVFVNKLSSKPAEPDEQNEV